MYKLNQMSVDRQHLDGGLERAKAETRVRTIRTEFCIAGAILAVVLLVTPQARAQVNPPPRPNPSPLVFGIHPGIPGSLTPNDPDKIQEALDKLQGGSRPFLVRAYEYYNDNPMAPPPLALSYPQQYARHGRKLDLVLSYDSASGNVAGYVQFVQQQIRHYRRALATVQIVEEPNSTYADGQFPNVLQALVAGVIAAKAEATLDDLDVKVGFNVLSLGFPEQTTFWQQLAALATPQFRAAVDYVGIDLYVDEFFPFPGSIPAGTASALSLLREQYMPLVGLTASIPIHIGEVGWSTGTDGTTGALRTEEQQSASLATSISTVWSVHGLYNVTTYEWFDLRDSDSTSPSVLSQLGIMRDDYTPKLAFETLRDQIAALGALDVPACVDR